MAYEHATVAMTRLSVCTQLLSGYGGGPDKGPGRRGKVRYVMSDDIANGALFDVSGLNLSKLLEELDESSLATALDRIVASGEEGAEQHGFNSII